MPGAVQPLRRGAILWPLRAVLVAAVTLGLFAMHSLPGMAATPSMVADRAMRMPAVASGHTMPLAESITTHRLGRAEPGMGCSGDHATCMAAMRSAPPFCAVSSLATTELTAAFDDESLLHAMAVSSRAPPDVCLIKLCISRT